MKVLEFLKEYWVLITFFVGEIVVVWFFIKSLIDGIKCTLRNDILSIYDKCKEKEEITQYQLLSIEYSYEVYKKLKGNTFVEDIIKKVRKYKIVD